MFGGGSQLNVSMVTNTIYFCVFGLVVYQLVALYRRFQAWTAVYDQLPGLKDKHWLLGNLHVHPGENDAGVTFNHNLAKLFPKLLRFWVGRFICYIILHHPDSVKEVLKSSAPKPRQTGTSYVLGIRWLGEGLLIANGKKWARNRRLLTPAFHFDVLQPYTNVMNKCVDVLLDKLGKYAKEGTQFEAFNQIGLCSLDIICQCAMSYKTDCQVEGNEHPYIKAVHKLSDLWARRSFKAHLFYDWIYFNFTSDGREFVRYCDYVHSIAEKIIQVRKGTIDERGAPPCGETNKKRYLDFLDILLTARDEDNTGMTDHEIRCEVDTFLFEGHDTTTSAISNTLLALAQHPGIQEKARAEVDTLLNRRECDHVEWKDLQKFEYLTLCIKEGLRHYSPVHFLQRENTEDMVIDGMFIPKGSYLSVNILNLHHNQAVWGDDSMEYKPERFTHERVKDMDPYAFVPFSAGPRNCIGQTFAMMELKIMIARILYRFKLETVAGHEYKRKMGVVMRTENGILLNVVPR